MSRMDNPILPTRVDSYRLPNGLTVFLLEDHTLPLVAVNINYQVGSKNEKPGRTGFAHLFEHMMFQGSKNYNDDFFKPLQDIGGSVNGGTDTDRTRYWELVPAGYLERALWLEADRMGFLLDAMTPERLANQIAVVQNERRQNYENRPYGTVGEKMAAALYPPNHPYSWTTIGSMADLQAATLDDVEDFFRAYYTPSNASLCLAGDLDPIRAMALIEKLFGGIPPGPPVACLDTWVPRLDGEVSLRIQDRVQLPRSCFAWLTVPMFDPGEAALDVFGRILGGGKTSRLFQRLVYEQQIAQDTVVFHDTAQISGAFQLTLTPRPGHSAAEVERAALMVLADTLREGITAEDLGRIQNSVAAGMIRGMQTIGGFGGLSDKINEYYHYLGQPDRFRWDLQRYLDLTPGEVTAAARRYLGDNRVVARVEPFPALSASASPAVVSLDRSVMPGKGVEGLFRLPERQRWMLANGLAVVLVEHHKLPLVGMTLILRGGTAADPANLPGLSSLTAALLEEGAGGRSSREMSEILEGLGTELRLAAGTDAITAGLSCLKSRFGESLALFLDVIAHPDFPAEELERQRQRRLVQLTQLQDQPHYLAKVAIQRVLFAGHPYGHPALGTRISLPAVTLSDVKRYWQQMFTPANAVLLVAGDLTRPELETALAGNLGAWRGGTASAGVIPAAVPLARRTVYIVDKPGAAQSVIVTGLLGAARDTPDFPALEILNTALGGQFVSRLNLNLREEKGYTYGVRSRFHYGSTTGLFTATAPVQTQVTAAAVREMVMEIEAMAGPRPITAQELEYARGSVVNGYARMFETPDQISQELADVYLYGLPENDPETLPLRMRELTEADLRQAVSRYLHPNRLAVVIVGDTSAILTGVTQLGLGPVVRLDPEGNPLPEQTNLKIAKDSGPALSML